MSVLNILLALVVVFVAVACSMPIRETLEKDKFDNIEGTYAIKFNWHYSNKTSIKWGNNSQKDWSVRIVLSETAATYDCTNTSEYSCEDSAYMFDWNKLWGKARCGYYHDHHEDSDRFVFRKCSDSTCSAFVAGTKRIQIGAYAYDGGIAPYTGQNPDLLKTFKTTIDPNVPFIYQMTMDDTGLTTYILRDANGAEIERQTVQHQTLCLDNYYEGTVQGLYFGGTCTAPVEVIATYSKV